MIITYSVEDRNRLAYRSACPCGVGVYYLMLVPRRHGGFAIVLEHEPLPVCSVLADAAKRAGAALRK